MPDVVTTAIGGLDYRGYQRGAAAGAGTDQYVVPVKDQITTFQGRACTFRQLGTAGTTQVLATLFNASGSTVIVNVNRVIVDMFQTVVKAVTVKPPLVRVYRITTLPTGGTALPKVSRDTSLSSSGSVTLLQGTASHGGSATAITSAATAAPLAQLPVGRLITSSSADVSDPLVFFEDTEVSVRALEGVSVFLEDFIAAGNPTTDTWTVTVDWEEYTRP